jgi:hypothetical protein
MIYIFGDNWGFSYKAMSIREMKENDIPDNRVYEYFTGKGLGGWLEEMFNTEVTNCCERGMSNPQIIKKIKLASAMFNPGDFLYVLQTPPLRNAFVANRFRLAQTVDPERFNQKFENPTNIIELTNNILLAGFYKELADIEKLYNIKIILHGGSSKLNIPLAESFGLTCTPHSTIECSVPGYEDISFFDLKATADSFEELSYRFNYVKDGMMELNILNSIEKKEKVLNENSFYFSRYNPTERGNRKVAEMLFNYIDIDQYLSENKMKKTFVYIHY